MRDNNLLAPPRVGAPRGPRNHDGTIIPEAVDTIWGTDLTTTITGEGQHFGRFAKGAARGLAVRHDHGSQYMSDAFQKELEFLGMESSPAFVRAPEGNGCADRFIRTLKENLLSVGTFPTIEGLRPALLEFRQAYNTTWLIERHGFISPAAFRQSQLQLAAIAA